MTTYSTGNSIGSPDPRDLYDNAENLDNAANSDDATWTDRLGQSRRTMAGIEQDAITAIQNAGYVGTGTDNAIEDYDAGIEITQYNQIVRDGDEFWRVSGSETLPYTLTGAGVPEGGALVSVGDAALRQELADGTATVSSSTGSQMVAEALDDRRPVANVKRFGAMGDGETVDQSAMEDAVQYALSGGYSVFWPDGDYVSNANIPNFHDVWHVGPGVILRGSDEFKITPIGQERNTIYAADAGISANDGLSPSQPTTAVDAGEIMENLSVRASSGIWRIQFAEETTTLRGVRLSNLPAFTNRLELFGNVDVDNNPTTIWDGNNNPDVYGFRGDQTSNTLYIHMRGLDFRNWDAGAAAFWGNINILTEYCSADNTDRGFWYRSGYVKHVGGAISDTSGNGITVQYHCSFNIDDVEFDGTNIGVLAGRNAAGHVARSTFTNQGPHCISAVMESRVRTISNTFNDWEISAIRTDSSIWNNEQATEPDTFNGVGPEKPAVVSKNGGVSDHSGDQSQRALHQSYNGSSFINSSSTDRTQVTGGDFGAPFRIPGYLMYGNTVKLTLEAHVTIVSDLSATFELSGQGSSINLVLASLDIPSSENDQVGKLTIEVLGPRLGTSTAEYFCSFVGNRGTYVSQGVGPTLEDSLIRNQSSDTLLYRLYLTNGSSTGTVQVRNVRTYTEL